MQITLSCRRMFCMTMLLALPAVIGACATGAVRDRVLNPPTIAGAVHVGDEKCVSCHDEVHKGFASTVHGRLADFEVNGGRKGCESCHGPGSLHAQSGDPKDILALARLDAGQSSAVCLQCHSSGALMEWHGNEHALNDVACIDCHKIHPGKGVAGKSLKMAEPELCYSCHKEYQAKASFPSHHPVKEGKMTCSSCHQAHGSSLKGLKSDERGNDLCYNCHARYQGPFVFEHGPVQEDCNICHDPHGTVANNLLKQNEPFLCLQCHESHFHATRTGSGSTAGLGGLAIDGTSGTVPGSNVKFTNSHGTGAWAEAFGTRCTVCHSKVHGSDLPSQTAPSVNSTGTRGWPDGARGLTR